MRSRNEQLDKMDRMNTSITKIRLALICATALVLLGAGQAAAQTGDIDMRVVNTTPNDPGNNDPVMSPPLGPIAVDQRQSVDPGMINGASATVDLKKVDMYYADPSRPNISGFWRPTNGRKPYYYSQGKAIPLRGANNRQYGIPYRSQWQKVVQGRYHGETLNLPYGDPSGSCWPQGIYHNYIGAGSPLDITQTPGRVTMVGERMTPVRRFWTNGSVHPQNFKPTSEGHSIGHWEGDILVVDTVGVRPEFTLGFMMPHSSKVHFVERFRRVDAETLAIYIEIEDEIALESSLQTVLYYKLAPPGDRFAEDFCVENNRNNPDENLIVRVNIDPHKAYGFDLPVGANHLDEE